MISDNAVKIMMKFKDQFKNNLKEGLFINPLLLRDEIYPTSDWERVITELVIELEYLVETDNHSYAITQKGIVYINSL